MIKKLVWLVIAAGVAAGLVAVRAKRLEQKEAAPLVRRPVPVVEVVSVRSGRVARVRHVTGTVVAAEEARVAPMIMARLLEVRVREGESVHKGQVLAVLDARELEDAVAQAGAGLSAARGAVAAAQAAWEAQRSTTERDRVLHEAGAISDEQWERSQTALRSAAARLETARAELRRAEKRRDQARIRRGYARLEAPFDGVVAARWADPGDLAVPGKPILAVARSGNLRVRAQLPVEDLAVLSVGQRVTVGTGAGTVAARVSRIVPTAGPSGLAVFEADLPKAPKTFLPGASVSVDVTLAGARGLVVPLDALLDGERGTWVFVVEPAGPGPAGTRRGTIRAARVDVVQRSADRAVVDGPLAEGDRVVVAQPARLMTLYDGMTAAFVRRGSAPGPGAAE
ncbi:efflux RND transporter periplasmic adaptor subunit [Deferrisoma camini]|uniref:efflux RND transporter periplasmic adaptor subunit n=1 Tax=Deferrisoma camini TaxID=1035120 RepID=UPI00046D2859|nr:efflux RND transporter periplasmic adaptor subunit [Deferrisoma camini]